MDDPGGERQREGVRQGWVEEVVDAGDDDLEQSRGEGLRQVADAGVAVELAEAEIGDERASWIETFGQRSRSASVSASVGRRGSESIIEPGAPGFVEPAGMGM